MGIFDEQTQAKVQTSKDYYYILGVRPDATSEEIEEAYQEMYMKFGPHVNVHGQDPDILIKTYKDISDAYEILTDPVKRKEYDKSAGKRSSTSELRNLVMRRNQLPPPTPDIAASGTQNVPVTARTDSDRASKVQALALEMEVDITLKEAIKGTTREIVISDPRPCEECSKNRPSAKMQCAICHGLGYLKIDRKELVQLPAGLYHDMEIRLAEQGRYDLRAQRNGDLIVKVKLMPHYCLSVLGRDITCTVPVTIYEAVLGAEVEAPCATGRVVLKIQPLTQPGRTYRLKGLGLAGADQLVTIDVVIPSVLSGEEVTLFRKLREISREPNPREALFRQP
jgi:DnaJ-class molecular chaperone